MGHHLASTEPDLMELFELTPDLVCIADKAGYFKRFNPAVMHTLGYTAEELFSRPIASFIHPEDREYTRIARSALLDGKKLLNFQNRYIAKNGDVRWFEWTSVYLEGKELVFAIAKDITERKKADLLVEDESRKFKQLAAHFKSRIEEQRRYLGLELHEELAQLASVIKMDIDWLNENEQDLSPLSKNRTDHALEVTQMLINTIRRISFHVSPKMISDLGLAATLEWQCKEFVVISNTPCHFESRFDESLLSAEICLDIFRICQEALNNIMLHASAKKVTVSIEEADNNIVMIITDDGCGFEPSGKSLSPGLLSMQQRADSVNGQLKIYSEPGEGTAICVSIPVSSPQ